MENVAIISALIAAVVSLIGILINYLISKGQARHNLRELEIKEREIDTVQKNFSEELRLKGIELESIQKNLEREFEELRQTQMLRIMEKRIEAYPKLWSIHIRYETNWAYEKKKKNKTWAQKYVEELNNFNIEYGLFFSEDLYKKFFQLRGKLYVAIEKTENEMANIDQEYIKEIREIVYGANGEPGLSTIEKDDLGSYMNVAVARRK